MLWVLKRTVSMRGFFLSTQNMCLILWVRNYLLFYADNFCFNYLNLWVTISSAMLDKPFYISFFFLRQFLSSLLLKCNNHIKYILPHAEKSNIIQSGPKIIVRNWKLFFLCLNQNICCGYSKEPSRWDGSFEHPKRMFKLIDKKIITILRNKKFWTHRMFNFNSLSAINFEKKTQVKSPDICTLSEPVI